MCLFSRICVNVQISILSWMVFENPARKFTNRTLNRQRTYKEGGCVWVLACYKRPWRTDKPVSWVAYFVKLLLRNCGVVRSGSGPIGGARFTLILLCRWFNSRCWYRGIDPQKLKAEISVLNKTNFNSHTILCCNDLNHCAILFTGQIGPVNSLFRQFYSATML